MTPLILFIVLLIVLGTPALGWSFYRRQQFKHATELDCTSRSVPLPGKRLPTLRTRLGCALVALSFSGLTLLLGPSPSAWAAVSHPLGNKGNTLLAGQSLHGDDYLESPNGLWVALMQDDGNFVLYHVSSSGSFYSPYWATGTGGMGTGVALMQTDGNFVLDHVISDGIFNNLTLPYWNSGTAGVGQGFAVMQNDGNFVLYHGTPSNPGAAYWSAVTGGCKPYTIQGQCTHPQSV